ncbi:MAG TPA: hypothetical protein ENG62_02015, partial [Thermoplasmatales archaeon]|nr:hypothetical protein [Thermoplasmatales archaeon]
MNNMLHRLLLLLISLIISLLTPLSLANPMDNGLKDKLGEVETIIWFGAHPDDELYTAGTFGYYTKDLKGHLIIVSLYYKPDFVDNNELSARYLGNATYIRIEEQMGKQLPRCRHWDQIDKVVRVLEYMGVKDYIKQLILEYKPGIVFGFESTNGFRHSSQHVTMAKLVDKAVKELMKEGQGFFEYYYVLNRDPGWFGEEKMDPPPVTDVIELNNDMWNYKLRLFEIYSEFYPMLSNETWINGLQHKEYFRRVEVKLNSLNKVFPRGSYVKVKVGKPIPKSLLENKGIIGFLVDTSWRKLEPEDDHYNWCILDEIINEAVANG